MNATRKAAQQREVRASGFPRPWPHLGIQAHQRAIVSFGRVLSFHESASGDAHLGGQFRPLHKEGDGLPQLLHIARRIEKPGLALVDQFTARTEVRRYHRTSPCVGFENGLAQGFVGSRGQDGEAGRGDHVVQDFAAHVAGKFHVGQAQFASQALQFGSLRPIARRSEVARAANVSSPTEGQRLLFPATGGRSREWARLVRHLAEPAPATSENGEGR